jgi:hypothetical protein
MATIRLPNDFKEFLKLLKEFDVHYLLIGAYAVNYHGYVRATGDMDIWIAIHPENAQKITEVLRKFGFENNPDIKPEMFLQEKKIFRMGVPPIRLEITTSISGVDFEECYKSRITDTLDGVEVNLIDLENLKKNKKASGRPKDVTDFKKLTQKSKK